MTLETTLNRLKSTLSRAKGIEALVFWAKDGLWADAIGETLEHEEIVFYAEGLLMEGTAMAWQVIGTADAPDHLRLFFWQGSAPALPAAPAGFAVLDSVTIASP